MTSASIYLRRYTSLPALIHLLATRQLTLLDPKTWDDRNDSYFISLYKKKLGLKTALALCFSQSLETYHHWRVFSSGPAGVCIVFHRKRLLGDLRAVPGVEAREIAYLTLAQAERSSFAVSELPFLKRQGYKPESEFRAIYTSNARKIATMDVPIRLSSIQNVVLSPWMNSDLAASTKAAIRALKGCSNLKIVRSTLISNDQWKRFGESAR